MDGIVLILKIVDKKRVRLTYPAASNVGLLK